MIIMIHIDDHVDSPENENDEDDDHVDDDHDNQWCRPIHNAYGCKEILMMMTIIMNMVCIENNKVDYDDFTLTMILMMMTLILVIIVIIMMIILKCFLWKECER